MSAGAPEAGEGPVVVDSGGFRPSERSSVRRAAPTPCPHERPGGRPPSALGPDIERIGALLLHQQCWCWRWDIRDLDGNLLLDHGFARHRTAEVRDSTYTLTLATGQTVVLWGWGVYFGAPASGGVLVQRCGFDPYLTASAQVPSTATRPADLRPLRSPALPAEWGPVADLLPSMLRWIAGYERWVLTVRGAEYRRLTLRACPRMIVRRPIPATCVVDTWNDLADRCDVVLRRLAESESVRGATA